MANLDYGKRLINLSARRFDGDTGKADLSDSFGKSILPKNLEYLIESMRPIGKKYNEVTLQAAENVKKHLERDLDLHFGRAYRTQGSVMTSTNIKLHSDIDLLTIIDRYHFLAPALCPPQNPYRDSEPDDDIWALRRQSTRIMKTQYDEVDDSGHKSISITNKNLRRKVDLVFSFWYHTQKYRDEGSEFYCGIQLYDFPAKQKILDYPFAHISNVNRKGDNTNDGSRKGIRLIKTLKADESRIQLSSFELTCLVHSIDDSHLYYRNREELKIAIAISAHIGRMLEDPTFRKSIQNPNGTNGNPFKDDKCLPSLRILKEDLDQLIRDCAGELNNYFTKQSLLLY